MKIRMIALDLDGTLLDLDRKVPRENHDALRECMRRGIIVVLASGRSFESVRRLAIQYDLGGPIISNNGARVDLSPDGPMLCEHPFEPALAQRVFDIMKRSKNYFTCYGDGVLYQNNLIYAKDKMRGVNLHDVHVMQAHRAERVVSDEALTISQGLLKPYKFVAFREEPGKLRELRRALDESGLNLTVSSSWTDNIEVMPPGVNKGSALLPLMERFSLAPEQVMAFGDNDNDLDMITAAGTGVAMGNAVPLLKGAADLVAPPHDEAGVAQILNQYVLGGE